MALYKMTYAKTHLASLITEAAAGLEVVITGDLEGRVSLPDAF